MGFDDAQLFLDNTNPPGKVFFAGQTVQGRLVFRQNKVKNFRGFFVKLKGACDIHWTTRHSRRDANGHTHHYTKNHDSHEEYVNIKLYLLGGPNGEVQLDPGEHVFPFQLLLPTHCPSSFESDNGHIRYELKFVIDRAFKFDQEKEFPIEVLSRRDLNADPFCKEPIEMDFEESYCCWCVSSGICEVEARVPASGYCPGQTLRCEVKCANKSNVLIDHLKFEIIERRHFKATMHPDTRDEKNVLAKIKKGPIPGNTSRSWTVELEIPQREVHNVDACRYIDINYEFEVTVSPSGCHEDTSASRRIIIGDIRLREFEDDAPPHTQITSQITQYPMQDQTRPHYPGANQSYPYAYSHYPGANTSYPGANPPYPGENPPYPSPSNDPRPPYPGGPTVQSQPPPYPGPELKFPCYPGFIVPAPVENNVGANVPLLPRPGAPYPTPTQASPYAKASAPVPSTPDTEIARPPAFNPDHKEKDQNDRKY